MSQNLIQTLFSLLTPQLLEKLGPLLGDNGDAAKKGLLAALPALLGGVIGKVGTPASAESLLNMMKSQNIDGSGLDRLGDVFDGGDTAKSFLAQGGKLAEQLLGDKLGPLAGALAGFAGLKGTGANQLLALAAPLVMGGLAKAAPSNGFTPHGLMSFLGDQRAHVDKLLPPAMAGILGLAPAPTAPLAAAAEEPKRSIWPWLLAAAAVGLGILAGVRSCQPSTVAKAPATIVSTSTERSLTLPGGTQLTVAPTSAAAGLFDFLSSSDAAPRSFVFNNLTFETGSARLDASSQAVVDQVVAVLKAFPNARVRLDGYTDNTGSAAANVRLSGQRAEAVQAAMANAGIAANRLSARGFGAENPRADNTTEDGRAQNRRIEVTVVAK